MSCAITELLQHNALVTHTASLRRKPCHDVPFMHTISIACEEAEDGHIMQMGFL